MLEELFDKVAQKTVHNLETLSRRRLRRKLMLRQLVRMDKNFCLVVWLYLL
jgi:hypothetical protein